MNDTFWSFIASSLLRGAPKSKFKPKPYRSIREYLKKKNYNKIVYMQGLL
jgi:hypothetical protein